MTITTFPQVLEFAVDLNAVREGMTTVHMEFLRSPRSWASVPCIGQAVRARDEWGSTYAARVAAVDDEGYVDLELAMESRRETPRVEFITLPTFDGVYLLAVSDAEHRVTRSESKDLQDA